MKIKSLTLKNFLSIGNVSQAINFDTNDLTLVLGENLDMGGNDSRNGCGKTTILNGLSFALFGEPLTKIKISNLINKVNGKNMLVSAIFEKDGIEYKVERGRKPDYFYFGNVNNSDSDAQGENRVTQQEIDKLIGFNHLMFKHIIALNTYTVPFLSSTAADQREIIESLLGISVLSDKAETLKIKIKDTKNEISVEELKVQSAIDYNNAINKTKQTVQKKIDEWSYSQSQKIMACAESIGTLTNINIDEEITNHGLIAKINDDNKLYASSTNLLSSLKKDLSNIDKNITHIMDRIQGCKDHVCFNCKQEYHEDKTVIESLSQELTTLSSDKDLLLADINLLQNEVDAFIVVAPPSTVYKTLSEALEHKANIKALEDELMRLDDEANPYLTQLDALNDELKEVDYSTINELNLLKDHQEFLLKLLTNKDSFIRKKIINQNISFLNSRLEHYLNKLGLLHKVSFLPDLDVEITYMGKDLDFDNLSRGERTRLILSLSLSFRDAYEAINEKINLLFVDELIDTGLDPLGVELALSTLKQSVRDTKRSIFLISHRDELLGRIDTILKVIKENGFTSFEQ